MAASVFQHRDELFGRQVILFVGNEAACAAMTKKTAKNKVALALVNSLRATAAQYDVGVWTERAPSKLNPGDFPSRDGELSLPTEPSRDVASITELFFVLDFPWMLQ